MADVTTYLLRWDLEKFQGQISDVEASYTKFGATLRDVVGSTATDLVTLQQKATAATQAISSLNPQLEGSLKSVQAGTQSVNKLMESISQNGVKIASEVSRLSAASSAGKGAASPAVEQARSQVTIMLEGAAFANASVEVAKGNAAEVIRIIAETDKKSAADVSRMQKYLEAEMAAAGSKVREVASNVPGGVLSGGIIGGLIGAMVLGVTERDRKHAEAGEFLNVIEATGEALSSDQSRSAYIWFKNFQERAQWFYGISREESQSVVKAMVDAGYKSADIMGSFDKSLGYVGKNVAMATIALDKHFNQDTGTSIGNIIQITTNLGESLQDATDKYAKLAFAGQRSAMGISKFTDAVISGASAMQQYGIDVEDVASIMGTIQKHYEGMGLSPQYAGAQAAQVVGGISQGITNLSPGMKAVLAQQMFPELTALDALQKWEDGFKRAASGENDDFVTKALILMRNWSAEGGRSRSQAIRIMEYQGLDNRTAATLFDIGEKLAQGNRLSELTAEEHGRLKNALLTEGERVSELAKTQRNLTNAIAEVGTGLLKLLTGFLGVLILGFRAIPMAIESLFPWSTVQKEDLQRINSQYDALFAHMGAGVDEIVKGVKDAGGAMKNQFGNDFAPITNALNLKIDTRGGETMSLPFGGEFWRQVGDAAGAVSELISDDSGGVSASDAAEYQSTMDYLDDLIEKKEKGEFAAPSLGDIATSGLGFNTDYDRYSGMSLEQLKDARAKVKGDQEKKYLKKNVPTSAEKSREREKYEDARRVAGKWAREHEHGPASNITVIPGVNHRAAGLKTKAKRSDKP